MAEDQRGGFWNWIRGKDAEGVDPTSTPAADYMGGFGGIPPSVRRSSPYSRAIGPIPRPKGYATPRSASFRTPVASLPRSKTRSSKKPRRPGTTVCKAVRMAKGCPNPGDIRGKRANRRFPVTVKVMRGYLRNAKIPPSELKKAFPHGTSAAKRSQLLSYFRKHPRRCERLMKYGKRVCA